jgi:hypothetical protein
MTEIFLLVVGLSPLVLWPAIQPCDNIYAISTVGMVTGRGKPNCLDKNLLQCHSKKLRTVLSYGVGTYDGRKKTNCMSYGTDNNAVKILRRK